MKFEENLHPRLEKLEDDSSSLAKDLHKQMDNLLGLPPEPNQKLGFDTSSSNTTGSTKDSLKSHKIGFFEKLLGDKNDKTEDKKKDTSLHSNDKKEDYDPFKLDISFGSSSSSNPSASSSSSSSDDPEMKEYEREKKNLENFEKEIKELDKTDKITGGASSKSADSESGSKPGASVAPVMKKETSQAHPDDVPDEYRVEKPHSREVPLKMSAEENNKETHKDKTDSSDKKEKNSKEKDSSSVASDEKKEDSKESSEPMKLLPASEKESKKNEKKKSGFFSKLFGGSKTGKEDASKESKNTEAKDSLSKHSKALGKISGPSFDNPNGSKSNKEVSAEKIFSDETAGPKKKDDKKKDDPHDGKNLTEATSVVAESQTQTTSPSTPEETENQNTDFERPTDEPQNLTPSSPESSDTKQNKAEGDDTISDEEKELRSMENEKDEHSTSFVIDSLADELSDSSSDTSSSGKTSKDSSKSSDASGQDNEKGSDKSALKLQVKKDKLEKEIAELEETLKTKKAMFEDRTTKLDRKEKELDKREAEIDDRENILLTLQTDLIRERKELDKREFEFFMSRENSALPGRPTLTLSVDDDLKALPKGMSDERMKIEQLLNQTRTFAISKNFDKAKTSYNRLVDKFHAAELSPSEKKVVHLSIKELFNDINLLMNTVQDARQDGTLDSGDSVTVEGSNKQDGTSKQGSSDNNGSADEQVFAVADNADSKSGDDGSHVQ